MNVQALIVQVERARELPRLGVQTELDYIYLNNLFDRHERRRATTRGHTIHTARPRPQINT